MAQGLSDEEEKALDLVAGALGGGHTGTGADILHAALREVCLHPQRAGVSAHSAWAKSLKSLGQICLSLAERETAKREVTPMPTDDRPGEVPSSSSPALGEQPTDDDCDLFYEHDRAIRRAADRLDWLTPEDYD